MPGLEKCKGVVNEYVMPPDVVGVWIRVDNLFVNVHRTDEGVVVDIWPLDPESCDGPLAATYAFFTEAEDASA